MIIGVGVSPEQAPDNMASTSKNMPLRIKRRCSFIQLSLLFYAGTLTPVILDVWRSLRSVLVSIISFFGIALYAQHDQRAEQTADHSK
jgi:hypothetical protein